TCSRPWPTRPASAVRKAPPPGPCSRPVRSSLTIRSRRSSPSCRAKRQDRRSKKAGGISLRLFFVLLMGEYLAPCFLLCFRFLGRDAAGRLRAQRPFEV